MCLKKFRGTAIIALVILSISSLATALQGLPQEFKTQTRPVRTIPLADLKVLNFRLIGDFYLVTEVRGGRSVTNCNQMVELEIKNDSQINITTPFRIYFFYEVTGRSTYRVQMISGSSRPWYLTVESMAARETRRFIATLSLPEDFLGTSGQLYALLDVVDEEFMASYGRVQEADENNNQSPKLNFRMPPRLVPVQGQRLQTQPTRTLTLTEGFLDLLGSTIKGRIHLNNDNGHSDDDHYTDTNPFRANDCFIDLYIGTENYSGTFNLPEIYFEKDSSHYHYYVRDLDCVLAGGAGRLGKETLNIAGGKFMIKLPFETEGRVELRGWEYTLGTFYDYSAPDIDITKLDFYIYLTPVIREGKLSYSTIQVVPDLNISFTGALDTVFMNDALSRIRSAMRDHMEATIRPMLSDPRIKQAFEEQAMNALRSIFGVTRVESLRAEDTRIVLECR